MFFFSVHNCAEKLQWCEYYGIKQKKICRASGSYKNPFSYRLAIWDLGQGDIQFIASRSSICYRARNTFVLAKLGEFGFFAQLP